MGSTARIARRRGGRHARGEHLVGRLGARLREHARPGVSLAATLTLVRDRGSAAALDGAAHRHRKEMFLGLLRPERLDWIVELTAPAVALRAKRWSRQDRVVVHDQAQHIVCRAVCSWAGVPLPERDVCTYGQRRRRSADGRDSTRSGIHQGAPRPTRGRTGLSFGRACQLPPTPPENVMDRRLCAGKTLDAHREP